MGGNINFFNQSINPLTINKSVGTTWMQRRGAPSGWALSHQVLRGANLPSVPAGEPRCSSPSAHRTAGEEARGLPKPKSTHSPQNRQPWEPTCRSPHLLGDPVTTYPNPAEELPIPAFRSSLSSPGQQLSSASACKVHSLQAPRATLLL